MKILSFQSAVAFGHVGNSAAVFPLQRMGLDVCPVDTVQFSNHPGYGTWKGACLPAEQLALVVEGLSEAGLLERCGAVLSGYLGQAATGAVLADAVGRIKAHHSEAIYLCDPVMGDDGTGLYVDPALPEIFSTLLLPLADLATPNRFELGILTGLSIDSVEDAVRAANALLSRGAGAVVVTSLPAGENMIACLAVTGDGAWMVRTPLLRFKIAPNGAGDLLSALLLGHRLKGRALPEALSMAVSSLYGVLDKTRQEGGRELALVAAQNEIAVPTRFFPPLRLP
ncbi:MAG: pyridoxal kinase PdxY [Magnetospirillum sp.]|nr:pyridoxal kinase PdxY [Magnetospirillum sp.]